MPYAQTDHRNAHSKWMGCSIYSVHTCCSSLSIFNRSISLSLSLSLSFSLSPAESEIEYRNLVRMRIEEEVRDC